MHLTQEHHILFSCLQVALWPLAKHEVLPVAEYNANPEKLYRLAASQGVLGLTLDGMPREFPVTDRALRLRWELSVQQMEFRYKRQCEVLKELVLLFRSQGVELMLLKGTGISMLYPRPEHRECGDIDIYLMGDYDKGNRIIESLGIEVDTKSSKHSNFFYKGVPVENHKTITLTMEDDTEVECAILTVFPVDAKEYIALLPLDENGQNESGEVYLYTFARTESGDPMLSNIESDEEYAKAAVAFDTVLQNAKDSMEKID